MTRPASWYVLLVLATFFASEVYDLNWLEYVGVTFLGCFSLMAIDDVVAWVGRSYRQGKAAAYRSAKRTEEELRDEALHGRKDDDEG